MSNNTKPVKSILKYFELNAETVSFSYFTSVDTVFGSKQIKLN